MVATRPHRRPRRMSISGILLRPASPPTHDVGAPVVTSTPPDSQLDSHVGQGRYTSDSHESGEGERPAGRENYVSKALIDTEGVSKPVNSQEGNYDRKSGNNPDSPDSNREIEHRVVHASHNMLAVRTGALENRVSSLYRFRFLAYLIVSLETEIPSRRSISSRTWRK